MEDKDILIQDLSFVEKDLTTEELTLILFILNAKNIRNLSNINFEFPKDKNYLENFAKSHNNWKTLIIEALTIAGLFEIVNNLGIQSSEAREHLSRSSITDANVKILFEICEMCDEKTTNEFIEFINNHCDSAKNISRKQLEIYFVKLLIEQKIFLNDFSLLKNFLIHLKDEKFKEIIEKFPISGEAVSSFSSINCYNSKKMLVLVINQETFYRETSPKLKDLLPPENENLKERRGTFQDVKALQDLFETYFGYDLIVKNNLKHDELIIETVKATQNAKSSDGLIVCLLSHGQEGIVYGHNSIPVRIKDIKTVMSSQVLIGKPKILIIQACQGNSLQKSQRIRSLDVEYDGPCSSREAKNGSMFADFFTFWSTVEGFASIRHPEDGSWFIQEIINKIKSQHNSHHLMDICTSVINEVHSKRVYGNEFMLPKLETTFTKTFYFPKK